MIIIIIMVVLIDGGDGAFVAEKGGMMILRNEAYEREKSIKMDEWISDAAATDRFGSVGCIVQLINWKKISLG